MSTGCCGVALGTTTPVLYTPRIVLGIILILAMTGSAMASAAPSLIFMRHHPTQPTNPPPPLHLFLPRHLALQLQVFQSFARLDLVGHTCGWKMVMAAIAQPIFHPAAKNLTGVGQAAHMIAPNYVKKPFLI